MAIMITNVRTEAAEGATFGKRDATLAPKNWASNRIWKRRGATRARMANSAYSAAVRTASEFATATLFSILGSVKNGIAPAHLEAPAGLAEPAAFAEAEGLLRAKSIRENAVDGALVVQVPV